MYSPEILTTFRRGLVDIAQLDSPSGRWNCFSYGPPVLTTEVFPEDLDTTSIALLTLDIDDSVKQKTMDDILQYLNPDGLAYVGCPPLDVPLNPTKTRFSSVLLRLRQAEA